MAETASSPAPIQITINGQYVKDFSFENPNAPEIFAPSQNSPQLDLGVNVQARPLADHVYEVLLVLKLAAKLEGKTAFISELSYGGVFTLPIMQDEQLKIFLFVEAPRMLFPFARNVVANAVREGGFPQVLINPIDFAGLYQANAGQLAETVGNA